MSNTSVLKKAINALDQSLLDENELESYQVLYDELNGTDIEAVESVANFIVYVASYTKDNESLILLVKAIHINDAISKMAEKIAELNNEAGSSVYKMTEIKPLSQLIGSMI